MMRRMGRKIERAGYGARVLRGGSFRDVAQVVRCACRFRTIRTLRSGDSSVFGWCPPAFESLVSEISGLWRLCVSGALSVGVWGERSVPKRALPEYAG